MSSVAAYFGAWINVVLCCVFTCSQMAQPCVRVMDPSPRTQNPPNGQIVDLSQHRLPVQESPPTSLTDVQAIPSSGRWLDKFTPWRMSTHFWVVCIIMVVYQKTFYRTIIKQFADQSEVRTLSVWSAGNNISLKHSERIDAGGSRMCAYWWIVTKSTHGYIKITEKFDLNKLKFSCVRFQLFVQKAVSAQPCVG